MCGIVALVTRSTEASLETAMRSLLHRGPDAGAEQRHEVAGWHVLLGHRRLSILDHSETANQPFSSANGLHSVIFNGEIYNHKALRAGLAARGHHFRTHSDTEVLLAGLEMDGIAFLSALNGMFALALLDKARRRLILVRDPFGIKPLYFQHQPDGGIALASEPEALAMITRRRLEVDTACISEFLLNGFLYEPRSGILGVEKLPPGCALEISLDSMEAVLHRYHDPLAVTAVADPLETLLKAQLALEVEADVPVGVFFSGGIDSSALVAAAPHAVEAMFVDYGEMSGGDSMLVSAVAEKLETNLHKVLHHEAKATSASVMEEFEAVATGTGEPISDYTYSATRILARCAREAGFKVMLSGMGGDELFGGYPRHLASQNWALLRRLRLPLSGMSHFFGRMPRWNKRADRLRWFVNASDFAEAYTSLVGYFSLDEVARLTGRPDDGKLFLERLRALLAPVADRSFLRQAMHLDRYGFLAHNLTVTDRASMAESIEVRVPLLGPDIAAWSASAPDRALLRNGHGKLPLKRYLRDRLPDRLVDRPKAAFNPPLEGRIRILGGAVCREIICEGPASSHIDPAITRRWIEEHFEGRSNHTYRIWQLIYLSLWLGLNR